MSKLEIKPNYKYQVRAELTRISNKDEILNCQPFLDNLDLPGFTSCKFIGKFLEIIFYPPDKIDDDFIFLTIESTLKQIGLEFIRAILRQYVGNAVKTLTGSAVGGALGSRAGPVGILAGIVIGAVVEKALFDWKNLCECSHDEYGNLVIRHFVEGEVN